MRIKLIFALLVCLQAGAAGADSGDWKFSSSVNYSGGRYGTADRTELLYIPFTLKRYYGDADVSVSLPWLRQTTSGSVAVVGDRMMRVARRKDAARHRTESGPGDIMVRGTYLIKRDGPGSFGLSMGGKLKLPTADMDKGLGTGEMDQGAGAEFEKRISDTWTLFADGYFTIIGDTRNTDYNNQVAVSAGFTRTLSEGFSLTAVYATSSALLPENSDPRELNLALTDYTRPGTQLFYGLLFGMSEGSPDLGISAGFSRRF